MRTLLALVAVIALGAPAVAAERDADGYFRTGDAIRVKKVAFIKIKVYAIEHAMKELPAQKSKQAIIDAKVDKRFTWKMLRNVDAEKMRHALREAYELNGYGDKTKIEAFVRALAADLKEGESEVIRYDATRDVTTMSGPGGSASVSGSDFMRATWSVWLGKIDQPGLGDSLIARF
jgi:chalcone isomerase-like protein